MKILVVIDSLGYGGAERLLVSLLPELKRKGIECDVAVLEWPYSLTAELQEAGLRVFPLNIKHRWLIPEVLLKLRRLTEQGAYDAVWGHLYFGNLYAMLSGILAGIKIRVMTLHSPGYQENPPARLWEYIRFQIEKILGHKCASKIVAVSNATARDYVISFGWSGVEVIHNAIPVNNLSPPISIDERTEVRRNHGAGVGDFLLVTAARYVADKGHGILLDALSQFRDQYGWCPRWIAASHGPLKRELEQKAERLTLSDSVSFLDALPQFNLFRLMQSADVFVMPSLSEPFGIAAGEALALGVPCILSEVGGLCELAGSNGAAVAQMVKPDDSAALCNAIWEVYTDAATRMRRVHEGKLRMSQNFDTPIVVERWCVVFNSSMLGEPH